MSEDTLAADSGERMADVGIRREIRWRPVFTSSLVSRVSGLDDSECGKKRPLMEGRGAHVF